uniref:Uncharacterized protein n=1 Tax=Chelonoidis abingdonii TaxID=106734 RepID=A0A8C0IS28_CHEAB
MGKIKAKGSKPKSVFHVASTRSLKAKNKAKPVTTSLKKVSRHLEGEPADVDAAASLLSQL